MVDEIPAPGYLLGHTDAEHDRLIRQAVRLAPITENFLRDAGIRPGQRILDLGSGVGDVSMLAARMVGISGEIVGVERDTRSVATARARVAQAGLTNVTFTEGDVAQVSADEPFDAVIGRFILQFLPDAVAVLRSVLRLVRPGGAVAFQENSWAPFVLLSAHLPLWSAAVSLLHEASVRAGVNVEMGPALHHVFMDAGLAAPTMRLEMVLGQDLAFTRWVSDVVCTLQSTMRKFDLSLEHLGNLDTLEARLQDEVAASNTVVPWLALVAAWSRTPPA